MNLNVGGDSDDHVGLGYDDAVEAGDAYVVAVADAAAVDGVGVLATNDGVNDIAADLASTDVSVHYFDAPDVREVD